MKIENDLGRDDIRRLVLRLAIPSMLAQFVNVLYSVVDRMYIGNIPVTGDAALAGVGVCGPLVSFISAFAYLVGVGGSPLMSIRMGQGNEEEAGQILSTGFALLAVLSGVITALTLAGREWILRSFGASEAIYPYAEQYFTIYLMGTFFALMSIGMNQFIICQGFAKVGMASVAVGALINIILDPVLIFGCSMGVKGAALATVLSQAVSCGFVLLFLCGRRVVIRLGLRGVRKRLMGRILALGLTPFLIIAFDNVLIITLNTVIQAYGGEEGDMLLTSMTIVQSFMLMITMPLGGITAGTGPVLGFNFGAGQPERIKSAQKYIVLLALAFNCVMFAVSQIFPGLFVKIFTGNPQYIEMAVRGIRIYALGVIPLAVQYAIVDGFTGMGIPQAAVCLSMFRKTVYIAGALLIPPFFGIENLFYTEPLSDFSGTVVSITAYVLLIGKILKRCAENTR